MELKKIPHWIDGKEYYYFQQPKSKKEDKLDLILSQLINLKKRLDKLMTHKVNSTEETK